ncbi:hypothetical protein ACJX0J_007432, partial [Zea mays]
LSFSIFVVAIASLLCVFVIFLITFMDIIYTYYILVAGNTAVTAFCAMLCTCLATFQHILDKPTNHSKAYILNSAGYGKIGRPVDFGQIANHAPLFTKWSATSKSYGKQKSWHMRLLLIYIDFIDDYLHKLL